MLAHDHYDYERRDFPSVIIVEEEPGVTTSHARREIKSRSPFACGLRSGLQVEAWERVVCRY